MVPKFINAQLLRLVAWVKIRASFYVHIPSRDLWHESCDRKPAEGSMVLGICKRRGWHVVCFVEFYDNAFHFAGRTIHCESWIALKGIRWPLTEAQESESTRSA